MEDVIGATEKRKGRRSLRTKSRHVASLKEEERFTVATKASSARTFARDLPPGKSLVFIIFC